MTTSSVDESIATMTSIPDWNIGNSIPASSSNALQIHIPGYHFTNSSISSTLAPNELVHIISGYKISTKKRVLAKVAKKSSSNLEREFYLIKRLYELPEGPSYIVQPFQYVNLPSGLGVAIYADEGHNNNNNSEISSPEVFGGASPRSSFADFASTSTSTIRPLRHDNSEQQSPSSDNVLLDNNNNDSNIASYTMTTGITAPTYDLVTFLRFAIKATACLQFIHRQNVLHEQIRIDSFQWCGGQDNIDPIVKLWNLNTGFNKSLNAYFSTSTDEWRKVSQKKILSQMLKDALVYISPEKTGRTAYIPDHRSDVYSLGIVFFIMVTSRNPFNRNSPLEILHAILGRKIPSVHDFRLDCPMLLSQIIEKMTNKAPDDRYSSMYGVRADLQELLTQLLNSDGSSIGDGITPFPLGRYDMMSIFTLPKTVYGRQGTISKMNEAIEQYATMYIKHSSTHSVRSTTSLKSQKSSDTGSTSEFSMNTTGKSSSTFDNTSQNNNSNAVYSFTTLSSIRDSEAASSSMSFTSAEGSASSKRLSKVMTVVVSLHGPGGIGKSTLMSAVHTTAREKGYIASVKFDGAHKVPYSGLLQVLSQLLQQILSEPNDVIKRFNEHLKKYLGSQFCNMRILMDYVPELIPLLLDSSITVGSRAENRTTVDGHIHMKNEETRKKFQSMLVGIFRSITYWQMTTLFLDDLHQSDENSLELLGLLIKSPKIKLLIFIAYREHEADPKFVKLLKESNGFNIRSIEAEPFDMDSILDFLSDTLHRPRDTNHDTLFSLAQILMEKTDGSPFYVTHLLQSLERKKQIFFNWETNQWDFDLEKIQEQAQYFMPTTGKGESEKLDVRFMVNRLREVSKNCQEVLKWASFLGNTFSWNILKHVMLCSDGEEMIMDDDSSGIHGDKNSDNHDDITSGLITALREGYFVQIGADEFKWTHDRINQAAKELASTQVHNNVHLVLGRYMMKDPDANIFLIASHLMQCIDVAKKSSDRQAFRNVLMEAGNRNQASGTHDIAFANYSAAIELGDPSTSWDDVNYTVTLNLYTNAAALSWVVGQPRAVTELLLKTVFQNSHGANDRLNAYRVQSKYFLSCQEPEKGHQALLKCLGELAAEGESSHLLKSIMAEQLQHDMDQKLKQEIESIGKDCIINMELCKDSLIIGIMTIFEELCTLAYWSGKSDEMCYYGMKILKLTLMHGICPASASGFNFSALRYILIYKNYDFAEHLGSIALILLDKTGGNYARGRVYFQYAVLVLRWRHHLRDTLEYFEAGANLSLSAGDRIYTTFHRAYRLLVLFGLSENISDVLYEAENAYEDINTWASSGESHLLIMSIIRGSKALQGRTYIDTPRIFDGDDGFNDAHFVKESWRETSNVNLALGWYCTLKLITQVLYEHYDAAIETGYSILDTICHHDCQHYSRLMFCYFSLALVAKLRNNDLDSNLRMKYLDQLQQNQNLLLKFTAYSRINNTTFSSLIEAEMVTLDESIDLLKACQLYENAISQARTGGWFFHLCVAQECTAAFYLRAGMEHVAYGCIRKAVDIYATHGSYGKVLQLRTKYDRILNDLSDSRSQNDVGIQTDPFPFLSTHAGWSTPSIGNPMHDVMDDIESHNDNVDDDDECVMTEMTRQLTIEQMISKLDILDLASIFKSSQVMSSSETELQNLVTAFLTIIFESACAESGSIIIKDEKDKFGVWAYGNQRDEIETFDPPLPLSEKNSTATFVPIRIVHHTINTGETMFIHNVEEDTHFAIGPWFKKINRSVICIPIKHKDKLVGCLVIEGTVGIFTQRQITALNLLCQQMGISITNAFLFKSVQRVTQAYTRLIEKQKQALEEARISKEEAVRATKLREIFLANMSHEIRTPFAGFYGMISLLSETELDVEQRDLVNTAKESCEVLLQIIDDLLNFSKLEAGKVTLDVTPIIIEELIADVIEILIAMALQKQLVVSYSVAPDVPTVVMADANRLRQILMNLIGNAIKFTHTGAIKIQCSVKSTEHPPADGNIKLSFEVIDTGIGISDNQVKGLFAPFSQVDGSTTDLIRRKYGGTGLGLSICRQLVKLMSGHIDVTSKPGQGSTFFFTIDVSSDPVKSAARDGLTTTMVKELKITNIRVLIVGKYSSMIQMVEHLLSGIQIDTADSIDALRERAHEGKKYIAVILCLYLTSDPQFFEWSAHLEKIMEKTHCLIVMHYPSSSLNAATRLHQQQQQQGSVSMKSDIKGTTSPDLPIPKDPLGRQAVLRITYPVRRHTLLQILLDAIHDVKDSRSCQQKQRSVTASSKITAETSSPRRPLQRYQSTHNLPNPLLTPEEQEIFSAMHILIAEDNPVAQKLLFRQLTRFGFQVDCANNGLEAVEAFTSHPTGYYKIGFFDHHMPKCNGLEATKKLRELEVHQQYNIRLPIFALTADVQSSARDACLNAGMDGYLTKPLNQKVLVDTLRCYCKSS